MMPIFIFWLSAARATLAVSGTTPRAAATPATLSRSRRQRSGLPRTLISVSRIGNDRYPEAEDILFLRPVHPLPEVLLLERRPGAVGRTPGVPHRSQVQRVILTRSGNPSSYKAVIEANESGRPAVEKLEPFYPGLVVIVA